MEKELLLYSGGPDSTVLLKYFLTIKKPLIVLHIQMGWCNELQPRLKTQKKRVDKLIKYFKKKYYNFEYIDAGIFLNLPYQSFKFGSDDQWCAFIGALVCKVHNLKKMWHASFSYNWDNRINFGKEIPYWLLQGNMNYYLNAANFSTKTDIQFCIPKFFYNRKEIDQFKTKKEAWNYLEPELKKLVRSCESGFTFCGKCYKCQTWIDHKMVDENKNIL